MGPNLKVTRAREKKKKKKKSVVIDQAAKRRKVDFDFIFSV